MMKSKQKMNNFILIFFFFNKEVNTIVRKNLISVASLIFKQFQYATRHVTQNTVAKRCHGDRIDFDSNVLLFPL